MLARREGGGARGGIDPPPSLTQGVSPRRPRKPGVVVVVAVASRVGEPARAFSRGSSRTRKSRRAYIYRRRLRETWSNFKLFELERSNFPSHELRPLLTPFTHSPAAAAYISDAYVGERRGAPFSCTDLRLDRRRHPMCECLRSPNNLRLSRRWTTLHVLGRQSVAVARVAGASPCAGARI